MPYWSSLVPVGLFVICGVYITIKVADLLYVFVVKARPFHIYSETEPKPNSIVLFSTDLSQVIIIHTT